MLYKVLIIFRKRWQEVLMLFGLYAGLMVLAVKVFGILTVEAQSGGRLPFGVTFLLGLGGMAMAIVVEMQFLGFLKSAAVEPIRPHQPLELLRLGRVYFWRLLIFRFCAELARAVLGAFVTGLLAAMLFGRQTNESIPDGLYAVGLFVSLLVVLKWLLFVTAIVIVHDCTVIEAVAQTRQLELLRIRDLRNLLAGGLAVLAVVLATTNTIPFGDQTAWIGMVIEGIAGAAVLMVFLTATVLKVCELSTPKGNRE